MFNLLNSKEMQIADKQTIDNGTPSILLMERAGKAIFNKVKKYINKEDEVLIICSNGGNGGDGLVLARYLFNEHYNVKVYLIKNCGKEDFNINLLKFKGEIITSLNDSKPKYIVDAIFGVGLNKEINEPIKSIIKYINNLNAFVISVDIASGIDANNGLILGCAVKANVTYAIEEYKIGHFLNYGKDYNLKVELVKIGIKKPAKNYLKSLSLKDLKILFPKRNSLSNKGTYGHVAIIGGSKNYLGAPLISLTSEMALRMGVGYSTLCIPSSLKEIYCLKPLECTYKYFIDTDGNINFDKDSLDELLNYDAIALGMGIGISEEIYKIIKYLLENYTHTLIIDADGLNTLAKFGVSVLKTKKCKVILTPHIGEFARLTNVSKDEILKNELEISEEFAMNFDCILCLKNNTTLITDGYNSYLNINALPSLAKAGSGDFLSGLILGLANKSEDLLFNVAASNFIFGLLSIEASKEIDENSLLITDLTKYISKVIRRIKDAK